MSRAATELVASAKRGKIVNLFDWGGLPGRAIQVGTRDDFMTVPQARFGDEEFASKSVISP
jgi:hypothetical protein